MYVYMYAYMRECVCVFVYTYRICIDLYTPRYTYTGKRSQDLRTHVRVPARAHTQVKNLRALFALDPEDIDEVLPHVSLRALNPKP